MIGPSGAGKSTLVAALAGVLGPTENVVPWTTFVTGRVGLRRIRDPHLVNLIADVTSLPPFVVSLRRRGGFALFAVSELVAHAASVLAVANYTRNVIRKVGVFELARRDPTVIHLFDEGTILSAYQLFGYARGPVDPRALARFAELVPLPDLVVHVRAPLDVLVRRALERTDRRRELAVRDEARMRYLLGRATTLFDHLVKLPPLQDRTVTVELDDQRPDALAAAVEEVARAIRARRPSTASRPAREDVRRATVIAFVGSEATGKSTILAEVAQRLARLCPVIRVHAGKPPGTAATMVPHVLLPVLRRLFPEQRTLRVEERNEGGGGQGADRFPLLFGIRSVMLAYERRALLRRAAASGGGTFVLSDRYPSSTSGAPDGPQLSHLVPSGPPSSLRGVLAGLEARLYRGVPRPDLVFHLTAPLDVVLSRNAAREKREPEAYVRFRHGLSSKLRFDGVPVHVVDTDRAIDVVVKEIEEVILDLVGVEA